ncbi:MAG TPA: hypothetical protein VG758_18495 [Hyphomicrobiaceae bacterium]|nr:hypothetical protein [Hyphomicrobiaceae bacterium]
MMHRVAWIRVAGFRAAGARFPALRCAALAGAVVAAPATVSPVVALDEQKGEEAAIQDCDKRLCAILLEKNPQGPDLKCLLTKTWARSKIKEADSQQLSWGFGDARCTVDINLSRETLVAVLAGERGTFRVPPHTAKCVVEQDKKLETVTAVVAPKIEFRNGRAEKIWIRLKSVEGPSAITFTVETAAQLADTFGLFHRRMVKNVNRYIERHCPTTQAVAAKPPPAKGKAATK